MSKLTDSQLIVLSAAAARDDGSAVAPQEMRRAAASKVGSSLVARKLMREVRAKTGMPVWREDESGRPLSLIMTKAGRDAIGVGDDRDELSEVLAQGKKASRKSPAAVAKPLKDEAGCRAINQFILAAQKLEAGAGRQNALGEVGRNSRRSHRGDGLAAAYDASGADRPSKARLYDRAVSDRWRGIDLSHRRTVSRSDGLIMRPSSKPSQPTLRPAESIEQEIARLGAMTIGELRDAWRATFGAEPAVGFSKDLLARAISYRLQEQALGGLNASTARLLRSLSRPGVEAPRQVKVGSVIVREHRGVLHEVMVVPGGFCWQGKTYDSLSSIAKKITGVTWNGPRFFGLRSKKPSETLEDASNDPAAPDRGQTTERRNGRAGRRSSLRTGSLASPGGCR